MDGESPDDPRIGVVVQNRYRILERLADGSMGVVYRGERLQIGRQVAIKFLHASYAQDKQFIQRFERETVVMSRLTHPHCVSVIDFGVEDAPYVVMEFVAGVTLKSLLEGGRLPVERAAGMTRQILAGLAHAHSQGIVHRDIKPANVMLTEATGTGDHVRILDFGLATLRGAGASDLSQTAIVVGTPNYMSPEQSLATKVDARSDIYSTGVVLFELLTGEKPFSAEDTFQLLELHRSAPVPRLAEVAPSAAFPGGMQEVIDRALAKDPADRFASAIEFAEALEACLGSGRPAPEPAAGRRSELAFAPTTAMKAPSPPPRRGGLFTSLLALLMIGGAAWAGYQAWQSRDRLAAMLGQEDPAGEAGPPAGHEPPVGPGAAGTAGAAAVPTGASGAAVLDAGGLVGGEVEFEILSFDAGPADAAAGDAAAEAGDAGPDEEEDPPEPPLPAEEQDEPVAPVPDDADEVDSAEPRTPKEAEPRVEPEPEPIPEPTITAPVPKPNPIDTVAEAVAAIRAGRREAAISALLKLRKKTPKSAYIPYLLGNLYFEKRWWTVGMDHYRAAIRNNRLYRGKRILNQNVIRALGSARTRRKAWSLFVGAIGTSALPHLRKAARTDKNPEVRRQAAALVKRLTPKKKKKRSRPARRRR